jgi:sugar lactone lactonase YvrE
MNKSGCRTNKEYYNMMSEPGSNGLLRMNGALIPTAKRESINLSFCQHGERAVSLIRGNGSRTLMAIHYKRRRFNSPNDLIWSPEGNLYFTDPDYGLITKNGSQIGREMKFNGVYMIREVDISENLLTGEAAENFILLDRKFHIVKWISFCT